MGASLRKWDQSWLQTASYFPGSSFPSAKSSQPMGPPWPRGEWAPRAWPSQPATPRRPCPPEPPSPCPSCATPPMLPEPRPGLLPKASCPEGFHGARGGSLDSSPLGIGAPAPALAPVHRIPSLWAHRTLFSMTSPVRIHPCSWPAFQQSPWSTVAGNDLYGALGQLRF